MKHLELSLAIHLFSCLFLLSCLNSLCAFYILLSVLTVLEKLPRGSFLRMGWNVASSKKDLNLLLLRTRSTSSPELLWCTPASWSFLDASGKLYLGYLSAQGLVCGHNFPELSFSPDLLDAKKLFFVVSTGGGRREDGLLVHTHPGRVAL